MNQPSMEQVLGLPPKDVLALFETSEKGLTIEEAANRLETYGPNSITGTRPSSVVLRFLSHFKNPVTMILLFAAILSGILGDIANCIIIFIIILVSVSLDFSQEYRAERTAEEL